mmetsp:Transcript_7738/g.18071  ORF Transcript_7738/g.18071 Transcript_7738/m.18071 type:complete len:221 (-) Transcript_7738:130-792(-)
MSAYQLLNAYPLTVGRLTSTSTRSYSVCDPRYECVSFSMALSPSCTVSTQHPTLLNRCSMAIPAISQSSTCKILTTRGGSDGIVPGAEGSPCLLLSISALGSQRCSTARSIMMDRGLGSTSLNSWFNSTLTASFSSSAVSATSVEGERTWCLAGARACSALDRFKYQCAMSKPVTSGRSMSRMTRSKMVFVSCTQASLPDAAHCSLMATLTPSCCIESSI